MFGDDDRTVKQLRNLRYLQSLQNGMCENNQREGKLYLKG